jgi:parallel beta-helix repeat protein
LHERRRDFILAGHGSKRGEVIEMFKNFLRVLALLTMGVGLHSQSAFATTVVVGGAACQPNIKPHYVTIQAAVNASTVGGTVIVCPGIYPEQVTITKSITIKGVTDGNLGLAVITVPTGGLVPNAPTSTYGLVATQLLVQNATPVNISNIAIDGTGGGCPTTSGYDHVAGIEIVNSGDAVSGVTIRRVVVRNITGACTLGVGLHAENSGLTIDTNNIHDIDGVALIQFGGDSQIMNNFVQTTSNGIVLHAVTLQSGVTNNTIITSGSAGVTLEAGTSTAYITKNTIGPFVGFGIFITNSAGNSASSNRVTADWAGVLLNSTGQNTLWANTFTNLGYAGIWDEFSTGGNAVNNNTVSEAPFGIVAVSPANDDLSGNTLVSVTTVTGP